MRHLWRRSWRRLEGLIEAEYFLWQGPCGGLAFLRFGELGDGGCGLPRALCALAMTWVLQGVRCKAGRRGGGTPPLQRGNKRCSGAGRCGERTERCQWQKQRSERVAAVKISSVRRKAAQKFWAPQQGHRLLRRVTRSTVKRGVGEIGEAPPVAEEAS